VGWSTTIHLGRSIDVDQLVEELEGILRPEPFMLNQSWSHFSWGADSAGIQFVIGVASGTAVLAINRLLKAVGRLRRREKADERRSRDELIRGAELFLADAREVREEEIRVEEFEEVRAGFRVVVQAQGDTWVIETDKEGSVYKLSKR
jgi:hypothetical protein